ncbi:MAG: Na+/H+ antiporter NhaC family protein [Inconstantimicrobium porci]|uniref:Na+/H+ antiporter NhaC family protein n=1 Tax=Inconstantimicrobium porci TaxID=2652291 RepID=A0A7X2MYL5_9CLOT|nr:Na+/H+ antiporter NhaC family protein [Inconstantimicrobium porci]MDD6771667.1 Na+/H+ antiporter NhaC family protein [Inconstantimicrobium porci]MDY5911969.1 Na+/H+ antiporter NhaC family protein [Inconstantimicrobium porci]MSR91489.1 Na+/H+ antiporter NhaC family protein [Inconstantimicrobium porci]
MNNKKKGWALIPAAVFLVLYLGLGITFEYVFKIEMGFYNIPIVVIFMISVFVACLQNRKVSFDEKLNIMAKGIGDKNILTMILIFLCAGMFVGVTGRDSAQAVAYMMLSITPAWMSVAILFIVACFVSLSMGTSCGTITLLVPIAAAVSKASGYDISFCIGSVMGGAMFGDNLSFISDTTIAACNTQGCKMKDKFRANFKIALPAAILTLIIIIFISLRGNVGQVAVQNYNIVMLIPYVLVLVGGLIGFNVFIVLLTGIASGIFINLVTGTTTFYKLLTNMGSGVSGMYETIMVTLLVAALCAIIRHNGGFDALLAFIKKVFKGNKGGQLGMGLLVGVMDIATANNTVAIVMAGPVAKEISKDYKISPKRAASILDTFSCVFQGILPYGAQMLLALAAATECGYKLSAFNIMPKLFYPFLLAAISLIYILFSKKEKITI